eukprot:2946028-Lingulodinium_polyedra.AAC.1
MEAAAPGTPPPRRLAGAAGSPSKRRRLRAAATAKRYWWRTRWESSLDEAREPTKRVRFADSESAASPTASA